jgi:hypothetical protein
VRSGVDGMGFVGTLAAAQKGRHRTFKLWAARGLWSGGEKVPVDAGFMGCVIRMVDGQIMRHLPQGR